MKVVFSSLLLLVLLQLSASSEPQSPNNKKGWIVIQGIDESTANALITKYDMRGFFKALTLVVGTEGDLASLLAQGFDATLVGHYHHEGGGHVILERPDFEFTTPEAEAKWSFETLKALKMAGMKRLFSSQGRYFASLRSQQVMTQEQFALFPAETEFITVLPQAQLPINPQSISRLEKLRAQLASDSKEKKDLISDLISQVNSDSLIAFDTYLSGERNDSTINSRNSFSPEITTVANWIATEFRSSGFTAELESFRANYGPNVIATLKGQEFPDVYVVIGAHFDSRSTDSSSGTQRAPGANDDGSGTAIMLEMARLIGLNNLKFKYSVIIGTWCGEEQGLVGSRAYAQNARAENMDILAMLQGDMLAYRRPGERLQVAFPDRTHTPELTELAKEVVRTYVPALDACTTSACCSDHGSFIEQGYAATQFFERCGSIADDQYHRSGDLVYRNGFDIEQWTLTAQAMFANLLTLAEVIA